MPHHIDDSIHMNAGVANPLLLLFADSRGKFGRPLFAIRGKQAGLLELGHYSLAANIIMKHATQKARQNFALEVEEILISENDVLLV